MVFSEIKKCRICSNTELIDVMDLGTQALGGRFPKIGEKDPPVAPLLLTKCNDYKNKNCGLLQLKHNISGQELFSHEYGYRSGINTTMTNHLKKIVREIEARVNLKKGDTVLDIGSNDATLLKSYSLKSLSKIGIDPTSEHFKEFYTKDIKRAAEFFSFKVYSNLSNQKVKSITSIAMFYDLPDPMSFVKDIKKILHPEGIWTLEQSYMPFMLRQNAFDTICHEHLEYYAFKQIEWLLEKNDLMAIDIDFNDINGGSFRITVAHKNSNHKINHKILNSTKYKEKKMKLDLIETYEYFEEKVNQIGNQLVKFIEREYFNKKKIYLYGASTKGNTLLQYFGLRNEMIIAAAERNPNKYGKMTPLTHIPIVSEKDARADNPDYFLVLPWHFKKEFLKREKEFLESGGKFIFPLPTFSVEGKKGKEYVG